MQFYISHDTYVHVALPQHLREIVPGCYFALQSKHCQSRSISTSSSTSTLPCLNIVAVPGSTWRPCFTIVLRVSASGCFVVIKLIRFESSAKTAVFALCGRMLPGHRLPSAQRHSLQTAQQLNRSSGNPVCPKKCFGRVCSIPLSADACEEHAPTSCLEELHTETLSLVHVDVPLLSVVVRHGLRLYRIPIQPGVFQDGVRR